MIGINWNDWAVTAGDKNMPFIHVVPSGKCYKEIMQIFDTSPYPSSPTLLSSSPARSIFVRIRWHWLHVISILWVIIRKIMTLFCQVWIILVPRLAVLFEIISIALQQVWQVRLRNHSRLFQSSSLSFRDFWDCSVNWRPSAEPGIYCFWSGVQSSPSVPTIAALSVDLNVKEDDNAYLQNIKST